MANQEKLSEQLALTTKLNNVVQQMANSLSRIERTYQSQVSHVQNLATVIDQVNSEKAAGEITRLTKSVENLISTLDGVSSASNNSMKQMVEDASKTNVASSTLINRLNQTSASLRGVGNASKNIQPVHDIIASADEAVKEFLGDTSSLGKFFDSKFPKQATIAAGALSGFSQGVKNVVAVTSSLGGFFTTFISGLTSITAAIIAIPLKIFTGLIDMAAKASHGSTELLQAIEDLRKEFGNLRGPTNKTIFDLTRNLKGFHDTGLSSFRVFGWLHERLNRFRELLAEMGSTFQLVKQELVDNGGAILAYQLGLGIANEEMANIVIRAKTMGVKTSEVLNSMTKQTLALGEAFGISQKVIGKDMAKAINDVAHFGSLAVDEIAQASVYARKLGIELEKITGTLDTFETFDSAADNVATLSQAFGVQLDTFKLVQAESPADIIDQLRASFKAAGHDSKDFNRQQLKLVSQMTGLDEATAKATFALSNQGVSLNSIKKKSQEAKASQMSQAEAMSKLADSIERLVKSGGSQAGSFWDMFIKGVLGGLQYSREFRTVIWNIKKGLYSVFRIGMQLGRILPKVIPELGELLKGFGEFFAPEKFSKLFRGISESIKILGSGGSAQVALNSLKANFLSFFNSQGPAFQKIKKGAMGLMRLISQIVANITPVVMKHLSKGVQLVADVISGKINMSNIQGQQGLGFIGELIFPIFKALEKAWPQLKTSLMNLWDAAWPHVKKGLTAAAKAIGPFLASVFFGPIVMKTLLAGGINAMGGILKTMFKSVFSPAAGAKAGTGAAKGLAGGFGKGFSKFAKFLGPIGIAVAIADASVNIKNAIDKFESKLAPRFGKAEAKMAAAGTGLINALTFGLLPDDLQSQIAEALASASNALFKGIENIFGSTFSSTLKESITSSIDIFSQFGQLIKDMFEGDEDKIADSIVLLGKKLLNFNQKAIDWLIEAIPTLVVSLTKFAFKLQGAIFKVVGKVLKKGKNIPVLGPVLELLGDVFEKFGSLYGWVGKKLGKLSTLFKSDGVLGTIKNRFSDVWDSIKEKWDNLTKAFSSGLDAIYNTFRGVRGFFTLNVLDPIKQIFSGSGTGDNASILGAITSTFTDSFNAMKKVFSWETVTEVFDNVVKAIVTKLDELSSSKPFKAIIDVAKKVFDIHSPSRVFLKIGDALTQGMDAGMSPLAAAVGKRLRDAQKVAIREGRGLSSVVSKAADGTASATGLSTNNATQSISNIKNINKQLKALRNNAVTIGANAKMFSEEVRTGALIPALNAAQKMIDTANSLNNALADGDLNKLNIQANLKNVAKSAGLGAKGNYSIKNKGVNITINMTVKMSAEDLEKSMVLRATSIIRDRINLAANEPDRKFSPLPSTVDAPVVMPGTAFN